MSFTRPLRSALFVGAVALVGVGSGSAGAQASLDIDWANIQWPPTISQTLSAVQPTANVYGQVWIDGVTSAPGATSGLIAQVGFGPTGSNPDASWSWAPMSFNTDAGNFDEFVGTMSPTETGTFCYTTRYSGDGGATWFYAVNGPDEANSTCPGPYGVLSVSASADTTAPSTPDGLGGVGSATSGVSLTWNSHPDTDGDLWAFEVLREVVASPGPVVLATIVDPSAVSYTDTTASSGVAYRYQLVAVDTSFNRSAPSSAATVTAVDPTTTSTTSTSTTTEPAVTTTSTTDAATTTEATTTTAGIATPTSTASTVAPILPPTGNSATRVLPAVGVTLAGAALVLVARRRPARF
ncbi:MAG: hypothetical protein KDB37_10035 [Ilumatobacter sp.]|nr:hypothetical protein [Ilumatobacter sp.]